MLLLLGFGRKQAPLVLLVALGAQGMGAWIALDHRLILTCVRLGHVMRFFLILKEGDAVVKVLGWALCGGRVSLPPTSWSPTEALEVWVWLYSGLGLTQPCPEKLTRLDLAVGSTVML